jgi:hypothetical protein
MATASAARVTYKAMSPALVGAEQCLASQWSWLQVGEQMPVAVTGSRLPPKVYAPHCARVRPGT